MVSATTPWWPHATRSSGSIPPRSALVAARNSVWKCRRFRSRNRWTTSAASGPPAATTSRRRSNKRQFPTWKKAGHALGFAILTAEQREKVENLVEDGVEAPRTSERPPDSERVKMRRGRNGRALTLACQAAALLALHRRHGGNPGRGCVARLGAMMREHRPATLFGWDGSPCTRNSS